MILFLFALFSIIAAIFWAIYALSPVSRLRRRARKAFQDYQAAVNDLNDRSQSLRSALPKAAAKYIEETRVARLQAIPVEELRNHRKGLLLQPLKQAGLCTLADVRGWDASRFGSIRGVGPSSALNIAATTAVVINESWNRPVPHPTPPFSVQESPLIEAIYRIRLLDARLAPQLASHQSQVDLYTDRLHSAFRKTTLFRWLAASLNAEVLNAGKAEAERLCQELAARGSSQYDAVTSSVEACAKVANNIPDRQELVNEFESNREFYRETLSKSLGKPGTTLPAKATPGATEPVSIPVAPQPVIQAKPIRPQPVLSIRLNVGEGSSDKKFQGSDLWIPAGKLVTVRGYTIPGGLLYLGHLDLSKSSSEPSIIDPTLPVAGPTSCHERLMSYWPSYSSITPEARAAYLNWLSTGKSDPQADIGYVFLYFYGLEKRLFTLPSYNPEVETIREEVERLAGIYGDRGTFGGYSGSLLDYIEAKNITVPSLDALPAAPEPKEADVHHLSLKVGAGVYAAAGKPLPADWAHCLYASMKSKPLHLVDEGFADLGRQVFIHIYKERFGDGLVLPTTGPRISADHHFGNASLLNSKAARIELSLPDVTMNQSATEEILKVGAEASGIVRKYSAFATENPEESNSLSGLGILPPALWPSEIREVYQSFRAGSPRVMTFKELPGYPASGAIKRFRLNNFLEKLASIGLGIEPDSRLGADLPAPDDPVAIFAANELERCNSVSNRFNGAELLLQLASIVACSSERFSDTEASVILNHLECESELPQQEKLRLAARLAIYRKFPPSTARLKKKINEMAIGVRESIGNFLVLVAAADGTIDPGEVRTLENLFQLLGLETSALYSKIHKAQTQGNVISSGMKDAASRVGGIHFDSERIASLRSESAKISTILDKVFESPAEDVQSVAAPVNSGQDALLGLDLEHADLLKALLSKTQWTRPEAEQLCSERGLMVDGAFERINDAAFERFDSPILEGDDPIDINCDLVAKETA